jgi:hypothetical protein
VIVAGGNPGGEAARDACRGSPCGGLMQIETIGLPALSAGFFV